MWEDTIRKRKRKLKYQLLKQITLAKGKEMEGKVLNGDEFLQFLKVIWLVYETQHSNIPLSRIRHTITRILKENGLLEIKKKTETEFKSGKYIGKRSYRMYYFI